jgi:hypothetical protein
VAAGRGRVNGALPDPALRRAGGAAPAGARGGQLPGRRAGEGSIRLCTVRVPRAGEIEEGGWHGRSGGRDGGTEDVHGRSLRRVPPGLVVQEVDVHLARLELERGRLRQRVGGTLAVLQAGRSRAGGRKGRRPAGDQGDAAQDVSASTDANSGSNAWMAPDDRSGKGEAECTLSRKGRSRVHPFRKRAKQSAPFLRSERRSRMHLFVKKAKRSAPFPPKRRSGVHLFSPPRSPLSPPPSPASSHGWSLSGGVCVGAVGGRWPAGRRVDLARVDGRVATQQVTRTTLLRMFLLVRNSYASLRKPSG